MKRKFASYKKRITPVLLRTLDQHEQKFSKWYGSGGKQVVRRVRKFTIQGKMIRGGLVIFAYETSRPRSSAAVVRAAAAIELFHAALLIHDDIMDRSMLRRGLPSVYAQYARLAAERGFVTPGHYGMSQAIGVGDIYLFMAFSLLADVQLPSTRKQKMIRLFAEEMMKVGIAQMQEMELSAQKTLPSRQKILDVYRHKTARYTFSLPLMLGALMAGKSRQHMRSFEQIGEKMGVIFQIRDDELGIFSTEQESGKSVGTDIAEHKKTLLYYYLMKRAVAADKKTVDEIFQNNKITKQHVKTVLACMQKYGVQQLVQHDVSQLKIDAQKKIKAMHINNKDKKILLTLLEYILQRRK